nr:glycosyltransferase family A protein [Gilvimarinus xylanilyticus]
MPVYNNAATLPAAARSVLEQTWQNLELIIVDDGSTDASAAKAREIVQQDSRVRFLTQANSGAYAARNRAMEQAHGEWVTVHDGDDISHPQKLERQLEPVLTEPGRVASISSWVRVDESVCPIGPWGLGEAMTEANLSSLLIKRKALATTGMWDEVNAAADTEFLWRLEHHYGHRAIIHVHLAVPLALALTSADSLTQAKATHAQTVLFGARRLYREAARWWHRHSQFKPVLNQPRPFPCPLGLLRDYHSPDVVVAADFSQFDAPFAMQLEALTQSYRGKTLCFFHWPDFHQWSSAPIADGVFRLCQQHGIHWAHSRLTLNAQILVLMDESLWEYPLTESVHLPALVQVITADGRDCQAAESIRNYFQCGGVEYAGAARAE